MGESYLRAKHGAHPHFVKDRRVLAGRSPDWTRDELILALDL